MINKDAIKTELMESHPIHSYYRTLSSVLKDFKSLKPAVAKKYIYNILYPFNLDSENIEYNSLEKILIENKNEIWINTFDSYYGNKIIKISPYGAEILAELYKKGLFDNCLKNSKIKDIELPEVMEYISNIKLIRKEYNKKIEAMLRVEEVVDDPSLITIDDFCYNTLDRIFINKFGLRQGTSSIVLAGIPVVKEVRTYLSNSGKSKSSEVKISWSVPGGESASEKKESLYSDNRRNSEERNWGLPE